MNRNTWGDWNEPFRDVVAKLLSWGHSGILALPNLAAALLVFLLFWMLGRLIRRGMTRALARTSTPRQIQRLLVTLTGLVVVATGLFIALGILQLDKALTSLLAGAGILGLALSFAVQDITANFISGIFLAIRRPFRIGELIETNGFQGTVERIDLRATVLRRPSGQIVMIPNKMIFEHPILNFSQTGERRVEINFGAAYKDDLEAVEGAARLRGGEDHHAHRELHPGLRGRLQELVRGLARQGRPGRLKREPERAGSGVRDGRGRPGWKKRPLSDQPHADLGLLAARLRHQAHVVDFAPVPEVEQRIETDLVLVIFEVDDLGLPVLEHHLGEAHLRGALRDVEKESPPPLVHVERHLRPAVAALQRLRVLPEDGIARRSRGHDHRAERDPRQVGAGSDAHHDARRPHDDMRQRAMNRKIGVHANDAARPTMDDPHPRRLRIGSRVRDQERESQRTKNNEAFHRDLQSFPQCRRPSVGRRLGMEQGRRGDLAGFTVSELP